MPLGSFRIAASASLAVALAAAAYGQPFAPGGRVLQLQIIPHEVEGTLGVVRPGIIGVNNMVNEPWVIYLGQKTVVRVTGEAEADVLRPGRFVRFVATVDKKQSRVTEKLTKLVVFTPAPDDLRTPGVFFPGQCKEPWVPGTQLLAPEKPEKEPEPAKPLQPSANEQLFDVHAQIAVVKGNHLTLNVPPNPHFRSPLRAELAEKCEITVDLVNYAAAKLGDKVTARGIQSGPRSLEAMDVLIELSEAISTAKKRPVRPGVKPGTKPKPPEEQQPFEVAEAIQREKSKPPPVEPPGKPPINPQPPLKPAPPPVNPPPGSPPKPPPDKAGEPELIELQPLAAAGDRGDQIARALELKPEERQGKADLNIALNAGDPEVFVPARAETSENLRKRFGQPDSIHVAEGSVSLGENAEPKQVRWELWTYGPLRVFVDEAGTARYFQLKKK